MVTLVVVGLVFVVPLACVIGVVKYERASDDRRSVPKLFRIDPADADTVESAARGIAVQGSLHGAGEAGAGGTEGTKKTTKKKGAAKGGSKGAGGGSSGDAGAAAGPGSGKAGSHGDGSESGAEGDADAISGLFKHIRLRACSRAGLRSTVTQFTIGK
jgi:hypothetical protein